VELGDGNGGIALNVSEGGLAITAAGLLTSDYFPSVRFQLPKSDVWIETSGQVAWTSDSKKGAGIQFVDVADSDREKMREWIATQYPSNGPIQGTSEPVRGRDREFLGIRSASKLPLKLETLSEADEAKFAGMFPSEKTLPNAHHEPESLTQDTELRVAEQNSRNVLRFSGRNLERDERSSAPATIEPADDGRTQPETVSALPNDGYLVENETSRPSNLPEENPLIVPGADDFCGEPEQRADDSALAQPESAMFEPTHNHSVENTSITSPPDFLEENQILAAEDEPSEIEEKTAGGKEQEPPAYVFSREADLIQQLELHRRNQAANLLMEQGHEVSVERRSGWLLAALVLLTGIACFAVGVGVGNGFFDKLLGHDQELEQRSDATPANLPAATPGENDFAGGSAVASNAQKSTEVASGNSPGARPSRFRGQAAGEDCSGRSGGDKPRRRREAIVRGCAATRPGHAGNKTSSGGNERSFSSSGGDCATVQRDPGANPCDCAG
jgi:hypothetical protein